VVELLAVWWGKLLIERERPLWASALTTIDGFSYPSGHATAAGMFATTLILLSVVLTGRGVARRTLIAGWTVLALVIASNRLFLGVHYLSDVIGGLLLG